MPHSIAHLFSRDPGRAIIKSERALVLLGVIALISSLLLWWANTLSWQAFPDYVRVADNLQLTRQSTTQAVILLERLQAGEPVNEQQVAVALEKATLNMDDCLTGRTNLRAIPPRAAQGKVRELLMNYQVAFKQLEQTIRRQMTDRKSWEELQIQQLRDMSLLEQSAQAIETAISEELTENLARQRFQQFCGLAIWLIFLLFSFLLLLRATRIESGQVQQQRLIQALLDSTPDAIFVKDLNGKYLFCNEAVLTITGKTAKELLGHDDREIFPAESAERIMAIDRRILQEGGIENHHENLVTLSGEQLTFAVSKGAIRDEKEEIVAIFGISRDITRQSAVEKELRHNRILLERTSSLAKVGGWEFDPATGQGSWTEECARIHDLPESETVVNASDGMSYYRSPYREQIETAVHLAATAGIPYDLELEMVTAIGRKKWVRTQCIPIMEDGKVTYLYGALHDISARKETLEALQDRETSLAEAQRLAELGSWHWDIEKDVHSWSEQVYHIYGHDPMLPPAIYPEVKRYFTPESWQELQLAIERCLQSETPYICDVEVVRADGSHRWVTIRGEGVKSTETGKIKALRGTIQDITERKQMENILHDSETRYRNLFQQSLDAIAVIHENPLSIRFVNPAFIKLFGYDEAELINMSATDIWQLVFTEDHALVAEKFLGQIDHTSSSRTEEFRIVRKDGGIRWVEATNSHVEIDQMMLNQFILRDSTPKKQAEIDHEKLMAQLMQAQKMESVGRLAGGIAHDFNNMLGIILGRVEFVEEHVAPEASLIHDIQEIKKAAQRSVDLTRQLLAFARRQTVSPKILNINDTVEGLLKMLRRLIGEDIQLVWVPAPGLWPVSIDPSQLDQILANICVNARDAIRGNGRITIETDNIVFDEAYCRDHLGYMPGEYVLLAISDDGCGMDKETLNHAFEPFFTTKPMGEGTGLGLSMVYGIIRQNNGFVNVYSEPGQGTTFKLYFPHCAEKTQAPQSLQEELLPTAAEACLTILLVEDEAALLQLNSRMLTSLGHTVLAAGTPSVAIQLAEKHSGTIDLLLTDVIMPEMNGRELVRELQKKAPGMKVLFMSGYTANVIAHHGVLEHGVHFLQKPFSKKTLATKLHEVMHQEKV